MTRDKLLEYFDYNPNTGVFTWIKAPGERGPKVLGRIAGEKHEQGYIRLNLHGEKVYAHRAAWLVSYGTMPQEIDHKNGKRDDNRISNLRVSTRSQNNANSYQVKRGVRQLPYGAFRAVIVVNRKAIHLGCFWTEEEAQAAYNMAADRYFGRFARVNRPDPLIRRI